MWSRLVFRWESRQKWDLFTYVCFQTLASLFFSTFFVIDEISQDSIKTDNVECSSSCTECLGASTYCTKCPSPSFALGGSCTSTTCRSNTIGINGTCLACNPECSTCSSSSFNTCTSCPSTRPILQDGRCLEYCPKSSYYSPSSPSNSNSSTINTVGEGNGNSCKACDWSCGSCIGPSSNQCTSCSDSYILKSGQCIPVKCKNGFVFGFGLCLEDLIDKINYNWIAGIIIPVILIMFGLGGWWFIRKQRKRTKEETKVFGRRLEDGNYLKGRAARFGQLLGLNRIIGPNHDDESESPKIGERRRKNKSK